MTEAELRVGVARRRSTSISLRYLVIGRLNRLRLPSAAAPERADDLWMHTCFEVFVRSLDGAYYEFNFAPSGRWAAYRFDGYRAGRTAPQLGSAPRLSERREPEHYELRIELETDGLTELPSDATWRLGVSAVLEDQQGDLSYWALAHPPGKPDFHHPDSFVLDLPPPKTPPDPA